jgi:hypothetical protein
VKQSYDRNALRDKVAIQQIGGDRQVVAAVGGLPPHGRAMMAPASKEFLEAGLSGSRRACNVYAALRIIPTSTYRDLDRSASSNIISRS